MTQNQQRIGPLGTLNVMLALAVNFAATGWMLIVLLGEGKTLGNAAIINKNDAEVGIVLLLLALVANADLTIVFWRRRRRRRRFDQNQAASTGTDRKNPTTVAACPRCGVAVSPTGYFCEACGFNYRS